MQTSSSPSEPNSSPVPQNNESLVERAYRLKQMRSANTGTSEQPAGEQPDRPSLPPKKIKWSRIVTSLVMVAAFTGVFWQRQNIADWWNLRNYTPTVDATRLATDTTMTSQGRKIFYLQEPQLQDKTAFYESCKDGETSIVLGCYKPKRTTECNQANLWTKFVGCTNQQSGIFLLKVDDDRLHGVEQVTAAHEMLHAAYDRLSYGKQKEVESLLQSAYQSVDDPLIQSKINQYQQKGADIANELHSILGSEVANLPVELEQYYKQYFNDRSVVVEYAAAYQSEFKSRKAKVDDMDKQLEALEAKIMANNQQLESQHKEIEAEGRRLEALLKQGQIEEYNAGVGDYNRSLVPFRALISQTKQLVNEYRTILAERNKLAAEAQELEKALDSRITPSVDSI